MQSNKKNEIIKSSQEKMWVVYLTTYPPRECGIATFTADLAKNFDELYAPREETKVVALNNNLQTHHYPRKVIFQIAENKADDYINVAEKLNNLPQVKLISVQHEFGIYGEHAGKNLLLFLEQIKKPVVVTFHTVLSEPSDEMKENMRGIIKYAERLIVMTNSSKELLEKVYGAPVEKIKVIYHGIHPLPYNDGKQLKKELKLSGRKVISTFGLLNRGKGIEYAIEAMPEIIKHFPEVIYLIIGATHPVVLKNEGEVYRNQLIDKVYKLGLQNNIRFYNDYLDTEDLLKFLQATDIYLSLSQDPNQAVSGTLTYALGAGRPVISTPFMQAKELITPDVGALIKFSDSGGVTREVISLFNDPEKMINMGKTAYFKTRKMTWKNVTLAYMREFIDLSPEFAKKEQNLPPIKLNHLNKLTDNFGIFQFANLEDPDPVWGYTLDDNARALVVAIWHHRISKNRMTERLAKVYLEFIERAIKKNGNFNNYFDVNYQAQDKINNDENLEDAYSRTIWALAELEVSEMSESLKEKAKNILEKQINKIKIVKSPRSASFLIKALSLSYQKVFVEGDEVGADKIKNRLIEYADFLLDLFNRSSNENWQWFEEKLTYSNAVLSEAMLLAYKITGNYLYFKAGKSSLDFLLEQSFHGDICVPVGQSGWYKKGELKHVYDQQPEEVSALVLALATMFDLCGDYFYQTKMIQSFNWFLGNNILNQVMYSHLSGGCYDGLREREVNLNQGAESTISYLLARLVLEKKN